MATKVVLWQEGEREMAQITIEEFGQVIATLITNTDWKSIDFKTSGLQKSVIRNPVEAGRQFALFLSNGGRVIIMETMTLFIDRTEPFDRVKYLGKEWVIDEQDERSLALSQIDVSKIDLQTMLNGKEEHLDGEKSLGRLKEISHICLDAKVGQILYENQDMIPTSWKQKIAGRTIRIYFSGTIFRNSHGLRSILCLFWKGQRWHLYHDWLDYDHTIIDRFAVLASA